ncbi:hypothetical protein N473_21825 [Pseudoalteromonas luteoviolacea CPMOR-1]|uniref:Uncharacterized protein n=1 Tax=Pseudoalteromonas luteoviolacea CPMOR-1 TaxID=1365248 RepID=A0A162AMC7_9GAMM|nr:hypothetical protein [Pseudoalteromonas luteoviolacea]KZN61830.1 hypothetical protein N473_21825 [Pseudoalteromonas luteoviolacea CPMOR-1]
MKLKLKSKQIKNLSKDRATLPAGATPQVGGGIYIDHTRLASCYICNIGK